MRGGENPHTIYHAIYKQNLKNTSLTTFFQTLKQSLFNQRNQLCMVLKRRLRVLLAAIDFLYKQQSGYAYQKPHRLNCKTILSLLCKKCVICKTLLGRQANHCKKKKKRLTSV